MIKFGKLEVIAEQQTKRRKSGWIVRCDCGTEYVMEKDKVKKNKRGCRSCSSKIGGRAKRIDLSGERFHQLVVISNELKNNRTIWRCLCDCGKEHITYSENLRSGHTRMCTMCADKSAGIKRRKYTIADMSLRKWKSIVYSATKRNISFNVTKEQIYDLYLKQNKKCALTDLPISFGIGNDSKTTASLDRINSNIGYEEGNLQWIYKDLNKMKGSLTQDQFIKLCGLVWKNKKPETL